MAGCQICAKCDSKGINSRGCIIPCGGRWSCEKYTAFYEKEKKVREMIRQKSRDNYNPKLGRKSQL